MSVSTEFRSLELRSKVTARDGLELWLAEFSVPDPAAGELVVRVDATPINPSDMILMFGSADLSTIRVEKNGSTSVVRASIPKGRIPAMASRLGQALPVGNEGAGIVVRAGKDVENFSGRTVAFRSQTGTYAQYRVIQASECMMLAEGLDPRQGASAFINPLTALGMIETMKLEGHRALVHTAAASSVGQMLNRLCLKDGISLVNIVRSEEQRHFLHSSGAEHVVNSSSERFDYELARSLEATDATLAFDAIGGGTMASQILTVMERVQSRKLRDFSRYGSPTQKQVYIYGILNPHATSIDRTVGTAWGIGGWLMTWFCQRIGAEATQRLRDRVSAELTTTFASEYTAEISLHDMLSPEVIALYTKLATGQKYLLTPSMR